MVNGSGSRRENLQFLMDLLGPQGLADLSNPQNEASRKQIEEALAQFETPAPVHAAIMAATDDELPAVVDRLIAESAGQER